MPPVLTSRGGITDAYYIAFPKDLQATKILVYTVFVLEVLQTSLTSHDIYIALGHSIGAADPLNVVNLIYHHWFSIPVSGGISEHQLQRLGNNAS